MRDFKEWMSDNLRYLVVGIVVLLIIAAAIIGIKAYSTAVNNEGSSDVTLVESNKTDTEKETQSEKATEKATEKTTEKTTEKATEKTTEKESETASSDAAAGDDTTFAMAEADNAATAQTDSTQNAGTQTEAAQTEAPQTEAPQTEAPETDPPQPVYMTLNHTCYLRSYADYGDNIIGEYYAGTTVEFIADVGGWYEVSVDGVTGYMGARFLN